MVEKFKTVRHDVGGRPVEEQVEPGSFEEVGKKTNELITEMEELSARIKKLENKDRAKVADGKAKRRGGTSKLPSRK